MHAVVPGLSGVQVNFPATVGVLSFSPVWHFESLVECSWSSVEGNVADALGESVWMEVLRIHVVHHIGFLVEFVIVDIFDSQPCLSRLLDVESVGDVEEVWVDETDRVRNVLLELTPRVEDEFNVALVSFRSDVVLDWSANLTLAQKGSVDKLIEQTSFQWHLFFF